MISLLGEYAYDFPLKLRLKYKLKDFLEKQVDEKYYLSEKMINYITATGTKDFAVNESKVNCTNARPITTEQNKRAGTTNYIADGLPDDIDLRLLGSTNGHHAKDVFDTDGCSPTITTGNHGLGQAIVDKKEKYSESSLKRIKNNIATNDSAPCITANAMQSINHQNCVLIKENTKQGYKVAHEGDGVNLASRMKHQRGNVQKGSIQTLKAQMEIGVVVDEKK